MDRAEAMARLKERNWTVTALAERWGFSRRHITSVLGNPSRGALWDDALNGLPIGPGFYRKGAKKTIQSGKYNLQIGSVVASEADMYNFEYGDMGVVVDVVGIDRWLVIWNGDSQLEIDGECLEQWVADLGYECAEAEQMRALTLPLRVQLARRLDLHRAPTQL